MKIVIASGKGGTGKTLVATSLALVAQQIGRAALLDADVEEPNAALFLQPIFHSERAVEQMVPLVDAARCTHCGRCAEVCQFNAIAVVPDKTLVFGDLCHGCGSCALHCPEGAIREVPKTIGRILSGQADGMSFAQGELQVGEAMATPIIRALKRYARDEGWEQADWLIQDAPPGTACSVIEALRGADIAVLVAEPTPFGLHDLQMAVQVARDVLSLPVGVVINKDGAGDQGVEAYCREAGLPILMRLPLRREIASSYAAGIPLVQAHPEFKVAFAGLLRSIHRLAQGGAA
ncbi:MAG: P-loop NTPase [Chloroflexi bacterium]|jgi:MinD superfamily P-loop ATPase|nr:P-loop NTPase [Chloroflexota bacterium]